ncbi:MAG: phospholipase, partial [Gammaproteobacteria bacterium]
MKKLLIYPALVLAAIAGPAGATGDYAACVQREALLSADETRIGDLKQRCRERTLEEAAASSLETAAVDERLALEETVSRNPFVLLAHRPNYFLFASYNSRPNTAPFDNLDPALAENMQPVEAKFQVSLKLPVAHDLFGGRGNLYFAYTNRSFWQLYNTAHSSPFRETNHEPEIWLSLRQHLSLAGWEARLLDIGLSHQSNGRAGSLSRSWNRIYGRIVFGRDNLAVSLRPWIRIPESAEHDDNPDINDYMGHFELRGVVRNGRTRFSLMLRNNLDTRNNRGALELGWTFPIHGHARGYVQWFNGYGESLIDYNALTNSIGFGIA